MPTERPLRELMLELTRRDISKEFSDFDTRLAFQKTLYLLQEGARIPQEYPFNYYARGPYSPGWAAVGYAVAAGVDRKVSLLAPVDDLKAILNRRPGDATWAEALASLHWYRFHSGLSKDAASARAAREGKDCLESNFDEAWEAISQLFAKS